MQCAYASRYQVHQTVRTIKAAGWEFVIALRNRRQQMQKRVKGQHGLFTH